MSAYRPFLLTPLVLAAGTWSRPAYPDRVVTVSFDPRLLAWLVNQAARRASLHYEVNLGQPPLACDLT